MDTTALTPRAYAKAIRYDRRSRDFEMRLDGELVGYAPTYLQAEATLNELVYNLLARAPMDAPAADLVVTAVVETPAGEVAVAEVVLAEAPVTAEAPTPAPAVVVPTVPQPLAPLPTCAECGAPCVTHRETWCGCIPKVARPAATPPRSLVAATDGEIARAAAVQLAAAGDQRTRNAANRAYGELLKQDWTFDGERLLIGSRSTRGKRYTITASGCGCPAEAKVLPCWHAEAWEMAVLLAVTSQPAPTAPADRLAQQDALYAALAAPGAAETSDLSPIEVREILASRAYVATA